MKPLVSVIVTTKNEEKHIRDFLESVKSQTYTNIEIIVVDHPGTTDKTREIAREYTSNVFEMGPERSAQRNYAVSKATGEYVLILDCDMKLSPNVVEECVAKISENSNIKAIFIPEKSFGENYWAEVKAFERNFYNVKGDPSIEAARFYQKVAFLEVGGFDEAITGPEDWDLSQKVIKKYPEYARIAAVIHHNEGKQTLSKFVNKKFYYARKLDKYLQNHSQSAVSAQTVYFLRPVFYQSAKPYLEKPHLAVGMVLMLTLELFAGALGYLIGEKFEFKTFAGRIIKIIKGLLGKK